METTHTADSLPLAAIATLIDSWIAEHYPNEDDVTPVRLWAMGWMAVSARQQFRGTVVAAVDVLGYTHQEVADALGTSRQNVSKMLLRAAGNPPPKSAPVDPRQQKLDLSMEGVRRGGASRRR